MEQRKRKLSLATLMGLPASGKTSLCLELKKNTSADKSQAELHNPTLLIIEYDSCIPVKVQTQFTQNPYLAKILRTNFLRLVTQLVHTLKNPEAFRDFADTVRLLMLPDGDNILTRQSLISDFLTQLPELEVVLAGTSDVILLIDDNNYYKSMRNDFYQIAKLNSIGFCVFYVNTPVEICLERNLNRNNPIPSSVIQDMNRKLEVPNLLQNVADTLCLQVSDVRDPTCHDLILKTLNYTLENPLNILNNLQATEEQAVHERRICGENEVHQADLILRKWIHIQLTTATFVHNRTGIRKLSLEFRDKKDKILEGLRSGNLRVTSSIEKEFEFRNEILGFARQD